MFGHDGHGSVRVLYDLAATITQAFTFSSYGEMLAVHNGLTQLVDTSEALTSLGYSGEHFDAFAQQQYLRARFYDAASGQFNRLDPFFGNMQDPQSLHKYAYVHGDPVQGVDPTGEFLAGSTLISIGTALGNVASEATAGFGVLSTIELAGKPAFDARTVGLHLITSGEHDQGFQVYNIAARIIRKVFEVFGTIDSVISVAGLSSLIGISAYKIARNFDELPRAVQSLIRYGRRSSKALKGAALKGTAAAAESLASRAMVIRSQTSGNAVTVAVVRVRNVKTNKELTLIARNGDRPVRKDLVGPNEVNVRGFGLSTRDGYHAEANIFEWLRRKNNKKAKEYNGDWVVKEGGASQGVCPQCRPMVGAHGLKIEGSKFWRE